MQLVQMEILISSIEVLGRTLRPADVVDVLVESEPFD